MTASVPLPELDDLPRSVRRRVRTLGHAFHRFQEGLTLLRQRLDRSSIAAVEPRWLQAWMQGLDTLPLPVGSPWGTSLVWQDHAWQVLAPLADPAGSQALPVAWLQALLLLHLPALKTFWQRALRKQRFELLQRALPRVWPLDTTPLPPGASLSGLGLASWQELPRLLAQGRRFEVRSLDVNAGEAMEVTSESWPQVLAQAAGQRLVVVAASALLPGRRLWAQWDEAEGWIDLQTLRLS